MKIINGDENKMRVPDALKGLPGLNEVVGFEVDFSAENQSNSHKGMTSKSLQQLIDRVNNTDGFYPENERM
jgi:hypothetical protein